MDDGSKTAVLVGICLSHTSLYSSMKRFLLCLMWLGTGAAWVSRLSVARPSISVAMSDDYEESTTSNRRRRPLRRTSPASQVAAPAIPQNLTAVYASNASWPSILTLSPLPAKPTPVQAQTFLPLYQGQSLLLKAPTGTGKTLAYLLPLLQRLVDRPQLGYNTRGQAHVPILVVVPTREVAQQFAQQAQELKQSCVVWTGGTSVTTDMALWPRQPPTILVATPGRVQEHTTSVFRGRTFDALVGDTPMIVLDEADQLPFSTLIRRKAQMVCGSATWSKELVRAAKDWERLDLGGEAEPMVEEGFLRLPSMDLYLSGLVSLVEQGREEHPESYKILVFLPAARLVRFVGQLLGVPALHSRMSKAARHRALQDFRDSPSGVLVSTDVAARGIDVPAVTLVLQYGAPSSRDLYIHRLGRTARMGRVGKGLVVLLPWERDVRGMEEKDWDLDSSVAAQTIGTYRERILSGDRGYVESVETAFLAFLAYYIGQRRGATSEDILVAAQELVGSVGLGPDKFPALPDSLAAELRR